MTDASQRDWASLSARQRLLAAALGFGLLLPLAVAGFLEPDRRGHGTHEQLGLPPCTVYLLFGLRCPTCGMSTSWAHLVRGQVIGAVRANAGGTLLGLLAMVAAPRLLWSAARGCWPGWVPPSTAAAWILLAAAAVTLVDWGVRMFVR